MDNAALRKQMAYEVEKKSIVVALLFWFFLGIWGVHDFYLGDTGRGIAKIILFFSLIGLIVLIPWVFIDIFLISGRVHQHNRDLFQRIHGVGVEGAILDNG